MTVYCEFCGKPFYETKFLEDHLNIKHHQSRPTIGENMEATDSTLQGTSSKKPPHPNSVRFHNLLNEIGQLHDRKQKDYGTSDDPFANINASSELGVDPILGIFIRMNDKFGRIKSYVQNGELANESIEDSLMDIAVYALIAVVKMQEFPEKDVFVNNRPKIRG